MTGAVRMMLTSHVDVTWRIGRLEKDIDPWPLSDFDAKAGIVFASRFLA